MATNFVYVMETMNGWSKIGCSKFPEKRVANLNFQLSDRVTLVQKWERPDGDGFHVERIAHYLLRDHLVDSFVSREMFDVSTTQAAEAVEQAIIMWRDVEKHFKVKRHEHVWPVPFDWRTSRCQTCGKKSTEKGRCKPYTFIARRKMK